jgi:hypothetical protein
VRLGKCFLKAFADREIVECLRVKPDRHGTVDQGAIQSDVDQRKLKKSECTSMRRCIVTNGRGPGGRSRSDVKASMYYPYVWLMEH